MRWPPVRSWSHSIQPGHGRYRPSWLLCQCARMIDVAPNGNQGRAASSKLDTMVYQTPWQSNESNTGGTESAKSDSRRRRLDVEGVAARPVLSAFRRNWGYLPAAFGSIITFFLLFEAWIGGGRHGDKIFANAFGRLTITTSRVGMWSGKPPRTAHLNGMWGILAGIACAVTLFAVVAVVINIQGRTRVLSHVATASSVAMAFFVVVAMVHLNSKTGELRGMLGAGPARDLGTQVGLLLRWASGNGSYPVPGVRRVTYTTAGLLATAWWAGAVSLVSAVAALAQWARDNRDGSWRLPTVIIAPRGLDTEPAPQKPTSSEAATPTDHPATQPKSDS